MPSSRSTRQAAKTGPRDLAKLLTYKSWQKSEQVIADAIHACERSQQMPADHSIRSDKVMRGGRWGGYTVTNYHLSRYACYLVVQNADRNSSDSGVKITNAFRRQETWAPRRRCSRTPPSAAPAAAQRPVGRRSSK